ncbi:histidine phosphatase superfamily [Truncatella angustata]|uniref:Phytase A n=1 Tax=Truncatella angustata TaxID=152316 RepID=A0A9P8UVK5_9PEZI|nr:histidine phosphatase superfamily [Truncatella angustata]KAH6658995.1 histidine phosphatase superfamily [Truncatella angustata]
MERLKDWISRDSHGYSALPDLNGYGEQEKTIPVRESRNRSILKVLSAGLVCSVVLYFLAGYLHSPTSGSCDRAKDGFQCKTDISHFWGQYAPYYSVHSDISRSIPKDCDVTFAQILSRHGARDPTLSHTIAYAALITRIHQNVQDYGKHFKFIKDYNYTLGADQLSDFGRQQLVNSGLKFYKRYQDLTRAEAPFVRSAGQYRVVESADYWTRGFHQARVEDKEAKFTDPFPYDILEIPEGSAFNNTLSHDACTLANTGANVRVGYEAQGTWVRTFAPAITERLNKNLPGANLTDKDTVDFMDLCPFETVADPNGKVSRFCNLFTKDEWHSYDYYQSLGKWYGWTNGNPLGPTQGVGFVNELIARMTGKPVEDHTDTNSTLDSSPETFPLDKALYADFSHDNDMSSIFAALGLYNLTEPLSNTTKAAPKETNGYSASWAVPFASRMYVEKMTCGGEDEELVRILVNDRVIPLQNCEADDLGRCTLSKFVDSLSFARAGGFWDQCFE